VIFATFHPGKVGSKSFASFGQSKEGIIINRETRFRISGSSKICFLDLRRHRD